MYDKSRFISTFKLSATITSFSFTSSCVISAINQKAEFLKPVSNKVVLCGKMEVEGIVDEVPSSKLTIIYPNGKSVEFGQELTPTEVNQEPQVKWEADPTKYYTLLMFDPDAPSREDPKFGDVKHWLVVNILGCDLSTGEVIAEYIGSAPPKDTGLHRYIFLVFEQTEKMIFEEAKSAKLSTAHRRNWSMRAFKRKYQLGHAFAGNYYKAQWEPFVDEFRKQFKDN